MKLQRFIGQGIRGFARTRQDADLSFRSPLGTGLIILTAGMGLFFCTLSVVDVERYRALIREDGLVEYASAVSWILAACVAGGIFLLSKEKSWIFTLAYLAAVGFFIVCCGEEISWGQRILGFKSPEALISINDQRETTLHNIGSISVFSNLFFLLALGVFLACPYGVANRPEWKSYLLRHRLPVVISSATTIFLICVATWLFVGIRFGTLGFHPFSAWGYYTQFDDELFEFLAAYCYLSLMLLDLAYKRSHAGGPALAPVKEGLGMSLRLHRAAR